MISTMYEGIRNPHYAKGMVAQWNADGNQRKSGGWRCARNSEAGRYCGGINNNNLSNSLQLAISKEESESPGQV